MKLNTTRSAKKPTSALMSHRELLPTGQPEKTKKVKIKKPQLTTLSTNATTLESILMSDPFIANSWTSMVPPPPPPPSPEDLKRAVSSIEPPKLNYNIEIFQGSLYPYPEYVSFLYQKALNLISAGEIGGRTCVNVSHQIVTTGEEPRYAELVHQVLVQNVGGEVPQEMSISQRIEIARFKTATVQSIPVDMKNYKEVDERGKMSPVYFIQKLNERDLLNTQLTIMMTTISPTIDKPLIASIIVLNNGNGANRAANTGIQYIDAIANNPNIDIYAFLKSSAISVLFTLIRETTALAASLPNPDFFTQLLPPTQSEGANRLLYNFIYGYLQYCNSYGKKPTLAEVPVVCDFKKMALSAINWNVAFIYRKLGFVPTKINGDWEIEMDLPIKSIENVLLINRLGFLFTVLQEIPLDVLTSGSFVGDTSEIRSIILSNYEKREQIISTMGVPGKITASIESIKVGGRRRQRSRRERGRG
jgi:hypothetical protein